MPTTYDDVDVKCPFFTSRSRRKIVCEGITDDCVNIISFFAPSKANLHCEVYCNDKFTYCEIYQMLKEKYEDEL